MATLFLSHASRNDQLASQLEGWLKEQGFADLFVDHSGIRGGDHWMQALRSAKASCRVVLCLMTPEWLASEECFGEFMAAWYQGKRIIPLIAVGSTELDETQRRRRGRVLAEDQGFDIARAMTGATLSLAQHPEITDPLLAGLRAGGALERVGLDPYAFEIDRNIRPEPFPGLDCFNDTDADAAIFFGRAPEIARCLEDLREMRARGDTKPYAIMGTSGSGKSSLMRAGVLPRLRRERGWFVLRCFRPGSDPLLNFADAIARTGEGNGSAQSSGSIRDKLLQAWRAAPKQRDAGERNGFVEDLALLELRRVLDEILRPTRKWAGRVNTTVLIAMDQGEELARSEGEGADALCDYFRAALMPETVMDQEDDAPKGYRLMFTVRLDSLPEVNRARRMHGLEARCTEMRPVPVFRYDNVVEMPAARYGVEIDTGLVEALMADSPGEDALPLLAFAVNRLWTQYARDKRIRRENYVDSGMFAGLIEDAAERALAGQAPHENMPRRAVSAERDRLGATTFVNALAQVNEFGMPLRRVARWNDLRPEQHEMLERFDAWRLVVRKPSTADGGAAVEPAHEALFRAWPRFLAWLEPEKQRLYALRGIESSTRDWVRKGKRRIDLAHRGRRLQEAQALLRVKQYAARIDADARDYLRRCGSSEFNRRFGRSAALVAATVVVTVGAMLTTDFVVRGRSAFASETSDANCIPSAASSR